MKRATQPMADALCPALRHDRRLWRPGGRLCGIHARSLDRTDVADFAAVLILNHEHSRSAAEFMPCRSMQRRAEAVVRARQRSRPRECRCRQGLRAAAAESDSLRVAAGLRTLATEIERGRTLDECIASARNLPPYVAGLIRAAQRTGDVGLTLAAWTENRRSANQYWRAALAALTYPALSVVLAIGVFLFFRIMIVPRFAKCSTSLA